MNIVNRANRYAQLLIVIATATPFTILYLISAPAHPIMSFLAHVMSWIMVMLIVMNTRLFIQTVDAIYEILNARSNGNQK